ncbi:hypothetical protein QFZ27_004574 [Inquilinus ginsengisoli]|uniref:hypothetical protein n=1 Tax=Inquilinus ginsengisoli TaxID=363840 RepID=UPI003D202390
MRIVRSTVSTYSLDTLEGLIALFRAIPGIHERGPGIFAGSGKPWLQIRQDTEGLVTEVRSGKDWQRFRMSEPEEREAFMARIGRVF